MAAGETVQARQAALLLYSLPPPVQREVVARLDGNESARLKLLLDELTRLGVSPSLGQKLQQLVSPPQAGASAPAERALTVHERVERMSAADVVQCLQRCAPATVAQLLRAGAWSWKAQVLGLMPDARRAEVLKRMGGEAHALAPAALSTLCERLCQHAAQLRVDRPQAGESSAHPQTDTRSIGTRLRRLISWMR